MATDNTIPSTLQVQVIMPEKILFSGNASMVVAPGVEGDFGVLPGHAPFISALRPGTIVIDAESGEQKSFAIAGGFAEVVPERCIILINEAA
jgi:F-type H+-transporting ATPase subunit epsilon